MRYLVATALGTLAGFITWTCTHHAPLTVIVALVVGAAALFGLYIIISLDI